MKSWWERGDSTTSWSRLNSCRNSWLENLLLKQLIEQLLLNKSADHHVLIRAYWNIPKQLIETFINDLDYVFILCFSDMERFLSSFWSVSLLKMNNQTLKKGFRLPEFSLRRLIHLKENYEINPFYVFPNVILSKHMWLKKYIRLKNVFKMTAFLKLYFKNITCLCNYL